MKSLPLFLVTALAGLLPLGMAQGTAFTYQGQLSTGGQPANGNHDLRAIVYDAEVGAPRSGPL